MGNIPLIRKKYKLIEREKEVEEFVYSSAHIIRDCLGELSCERHLERKPTKEGETYDSLKPPFKVLEIQFLFEDLVRRTVSSFLTPVSLENIIEHIECILQNYHRDDTSLTLTAVEDSLVKMTIEKLISQGILKECKRTNTYYRVYSAIDSVNANREYPENAPYYGVDRDTLLCVKARDRIYSLTILRIMHQKILDELKNKSIKTYTGSRSEVQRFLISSYLLSTGGHHTAAHVRWSELLFDYLFIRGEIEPFVMITGEDELDQYTASHPRFTFNI
jgi:hypothetical protein